MKKPVRLAVAAGAGLIMALTALGTATPATAATAAAAQDGIVDIPALSSFDRVIDPDDYECAPTAIDTYVDEQIASWTLAELQFVIPHQDALFGVPTYAPLFFGTTGDPTYALDSHAAQLRNAFRDVKKFWSGSEHDGVQFDDIQLMAMHGDVLLDADLVEATLVLMQKYDVLDGSPLENATAAQLRAEAVTVATFLQQNAAAGGDLYDDPLWTLNAYAFSGEDEEDAFLQGLPDKLVFGDGFLDFMEWMGLGDVGPRVVMGHEFGHHIQYELGLFTDEESPEATRRTELMADAYAAYYGVSKKGLALNAKRVIDALEAFYVVGDCSFDSNGHHGTPNQRERAAQWGVDLAEANSPASYVIDAAVLAELFDEALPEIVAPDAA